MNRYFCGNTRSQRSCITLNNLINHFHLFWVFEANVIYSHPSTTKCIYRNVEIYILKTYISIRIFTNTRVECNKWLLFLNKENIFPCIFIELTFLSIITLGLDKKNVFETHIHGIHIHSISTLRIRFALDAAFDIKLDSDIMGCEWNYLAHYTAHRCPCLCEFVLELKWKGDRSFLVMFSLYLQLVEHINKLFISYV